MLKQLDICDHTRVMKAVLENGREVARNIRPTQAQMLQAALEVDAIDAPTKRLIRQVLGELPAIERAQELMPPRMKERVATLQRELLATSSVEETRKVLHGARGCGVAESDDEEAWNEGIATGLAILEDGEKTIYSPAFVQEALQKQGFAVGNTVASPGKVIGGADVAGAIGGAAGAFVTGVAIPAIPVAAGAGAIGASMVALGGVLFGLL